MDTKNTKNTKVKLTKLITNQYIIGKTTYSGNLTTIEKPYMVIPDPAGIQMFSYDEAIIGKPLDYIVVNNNNLLYSTETGQELQNTYLKAISGIETEPEKKLILG